MKLTFLGTGTSQGVPVIGCKCNVCTSSDKKDKRFRTSALITTDEGKKILIDCGPDFRQQMIDNQEEKIDALLITHEHNDHIIGIDDLRPIIFREKKSTSIYARQDVLTQIKDRFPYAFTEEKYPGAPSFELHPIMGNFTIENIDIQIIEVMHYQLPVLGFKFKNLAYITDANFISESEKEKLKNLDYLIINCLRKEREHISHFILPDILKLQAELCPNKIFLTHINHEFGLYSVENQFLPDGVEMAYDGKTIIF